MSRFPSPIVLLNTNSIREEFLMIDSFRKTIMIYIDHSIQVYQDAVPAREPLVNARHVENLDEQYNRYEAQLLPLMVDFGNDPDFKAYLDFAFYVRTVIRVLYYEQSNARVWKLPAVSAQMHLASWSSRFKEARIIVAGRLSWLLEERFVNQELQSRPNPPAADRSAYNTRTAHRYSELTLRKDDEIYRQQLPEEYKWLLDFSNRPSLEWIVFIHQVARLTVVASCTDDFLADIDNTVRQCCQEEFEADVKDFTARATAEDQDRCGDSCNICSCVFSNVSALIGDEAEVAVMTECGHIFGNSCLQQWIHTCFEAGNMTTCPNCRRELQATYIECEYPDHLTDAIAEFTTARQALVRLDAQIDEFLLLGSQTPPAGVISLNATNVQNWVYGPEIGRLLKALNSVRLQLDASVQLIRSITTPMLEQYAAEHEISMDVSVAPDFTIEW